VSAMLDVPRRWLKATLAATAVVALLLIVATGSLSTPRGTGQVDRSLPDIVGGATVGGILRLVYLAILAAALYRWLLSRDEVKRGKGPQRRASPALTLLVILAVGGVLVLGAALRDTSVTNPLFPQVEEEERSPEVLDDGEIVDGSPPGSLPEFMSEPGATSSPVETLLAHPWLAALTLLMVAGTALAILLRRPDEEAEPEMEAVERSEESVTETIPAPPVGSDPRSRVFAAYRAVEQAASGFGRSRQPGETVGGHLRRLGGADARSLAQTYDRARFSAHDVTGDAADEAERAGRAVVEVSG